MDPTAGLSLKLGKHTNEGTLDAVPRRRPPGSETQPLFGYDLWNAYEVSFLLPSGKPYVGHIQACYPANSPNIVESKSFKLFLNAHNQQVFASREAFAEEVRDGLSACVGAPVELFFFEPEQSPAAVVLEAQLLDDLELKTPVTTDCDPSLLARLAHQGCFAYKSHLLRSNCPVTNQPDWGSVLIRGTGPWAPDPERLLAYLISFRTHQDFHESCCETLYRELYRLLEPEQLAVSCFYTRRGGLDINPHRANHEIQERWQHPVWRQ